MKRRGGSTASLRARQWLATHRVFPGIGWLGECLCGSSFIVRDCRADDRFIRETLERVAASHGVSPTDIRSASRHPPIVSARHSVAMQLRLLGWPATQIGSVLGCAGTSVLSLLKRHGKAEGFR